VTKGITWAAGAGVALLNQALKGSASVSELGWAADRTREVREEFLVFVDGLVALGGALVELTQVVVRENSQAGETIDYGLAILQVPFDALHGAKLSFRGGIVVGQESRAATEKGQIGVLKIGNSG
jgi:hypothetical protein